MQNDQVMVYVQDLPHGIRIPVPLKTWVKLFLNMHVYMGAYVRHVYYFKYNIYFYIESYRLPFIVSIKKKATAWD